jgi:voltage-gated potassium channel
VVALPVGIVATAFAEQIHRRDFVVILGMVARVSLFAGLNSSDIADIKRLLRARQIEADAVIVRRGEPAHFIAAERSGASLRAAGWELTQGDAARQSCSLLCGFNEPDVSEFAPGSAEGGKQ